MPGKAPQIDTSNEPLFFYMPDAEYGEFCQWYPSPFRVSKAEIASLIADNSSLDDGSEGKNNNGSTASAIATTNATTATATVTTTGTNTAPKKAKSEPQNPREGEEETILFNCAEQFMMYNKASRFHDTATTQRIMAESSPKIQKQLGKNTHGFYAASWDEVKFDVVVAGNMAKFGQNPKLRRKLLCTGERMLVEASSRDRVWGVGFTAKHALQHRNQWGENLLGKALMAVRERLRGVELEEGG